MKARQGLAQATKWAGPHQQYPSMLLGVAPSGVTKRLNTTFSTYAVGYNSQL